MELIKQNFQTKLIKSIFAVVLCSILLTISAKVKIPSYPVPMTMQTSVVLLLGLSFGYKIGLVYFTGPTMGYLIGFLSACYLASFVKLNDNFLMIFAKLTLAVSTIYLFGIMWLGTLIGWDKTIFSLGVAPFLLAEAFKILLLSLLVKKLIKIKSFI